MTFSKADENRLVDAIRDAESCTSGEIRIHLQKKIKGPIYDEAKGVFEKLGMTATQERNGILFFLAEAQREFAILGDSGIHAKVGPEFWDRIRDAMLSDFKQERFVDGLIRGVATCGAELKRYFPRSNSDQNELSDAISRETEKG